MLRDLGTVLAIVLSFVAKEFWDAYKIKRRNRTTESDMRKAIEYDVLINEELATLRDRYEFNRAALHEFSNGTFNLTGVSFKNVSMRYEKVDLTTKPIIRGFQNIPCSNIAKLLQDLSAAGTLEVNIFKTPEYDSATLQHQRMYGINQSYYFRLGENILDGCVCLSTTATNKQVDLSLQDMYEIKAACDRILSYKSKMPKQKR